LFPSEQATNHGVLEKRSGLGENRRGLGLLEDRSGRTSPFPLGGERFRVVVVRPRLLLDEISLVIGCRRRRSMLEVRTRLAGRLVGGYGAAAYRVYLRRLALVRLVKTEA
jgi:hypothetical protein